MNTEAKRPARRWWPAVVAGIAVIGLVAAAYAVLTVFVFSGCVDSTKPKSYRITKLKESVVPTAISPNGEYVLARGDIETGSFVLWHDGEYTTVKRPKGTLSEVNPTDVNDSGEVVVNFTKIEDDESHAWHYADGRLRRLPGSPNGTWAEAINADGTIVGRDRTDDDGDRAVAWEAGASKSRALRLPDGTDPHESRATGISDDGVVVGVVGRGAWVWEGDAEGRELSGIGDDYLSPTIAGDWVLAESKRWNLAKDHAYSKVDDRASFQAIDECGRMYGVDSDVGGDAVVHDGKLRRLPAIDEPVYEDYPDVPEDAMGEVYEAAADGSVLIGESHGWSAMWTYE